MWLWGQGTQPALDDFAGRWGVSAGMVTAVDLVRGLGVLSGMEVVEVEGATGWYDTDYEAKRDAALAGLEAGKDLFVIHVEATDEAGHAGDVAAKVEALENWDRRILTDLVERLDALGPVSYTHLLSELWDGLAATATGAAARFVGSASGGQKVLWLRQARLATRAGARSVHGGGHGRRGGGAAGTALAGN